MSAKNRTAATSRPHEEFSTPSWCVDRLLEACPIPMHGRWFEPACGKGNIVHAVNRYANQIQWTFMDIQPGLAEYLTQRIPNSVQFPDGSFLDLNPPGFHADVIIQNPPYSLALPFVEKSLTLADHVVALLRLNFLGSADRAPFFQANPPDVYVLPNRPEFVTTLSCRGGGYYQDGSHRERECSWREQYEPALAPEYDRCPSCHGFVQTTSSDSTEYAWFHWRPDRSSDHGNISVLNTTPKEERKCKR